MVRVRLLGEQRVTGAAADTSRASSSRSIALLAYLVLHAGFAQPRQRLAGIFWPGSSEAQARTNLRRELHNLRLLLGDDPSLLIEPAALTWRDTPSCWVDVRTFEIDGAAARRGDATTDAGGRLRAADTAIKAYGGELMPGTYDDWVLEHRDRLHRQCVDLCDVATAGWRASGNRRQAAEVVRRRIQLEPLEEVGYRALMELQAESGDRAAAMTTYHRCATTLEQDLGVSPDRETTALAERLLGSDGPPLSLPGPTSKASRRIVTGQVPLVGREAELAQLVERWHHATAGHSGLVLVSGQAGVGKSRLVAELRGAVAAEGAIVASTRCFGLAGRLALAPVADWLRSGDLRPNIAALEPVWRDEVERLVPHEATSAEASSTAPTETTGERPRGVSDSRPRGEFRPSHSARALVDAWQRHRFFEGLARAVLSADRPTLLVLDDVQWCDEETMDWLAFLLAFAGDAPLLVAATIRAEELPDNPTVSASLRRLRSAGLVAEVTLAPLDPRGTARLAASLFGESVDDAETAFLHATTGGYPLFLVEAARSDAEPRPESRFGPRQEPADVRRVLQRRLEQPSGAARQVAGLAAAVGRDFSLDLLSEASDLDSETLVQAVDELWRRRILREQGDGYDFAHDLLREAAYDAISPPQRWLLHRRLAQGLELLHAGRLDDVAAQLADQYDRAKRPDRALFYVSRAAEAAVRVFANAEALRHHRRSLEFVAQLPPGADRDSHELATLQAMSAPLTALYGYASQELQSTLERSTVLGERLDRPRTVVASLIGLFAVQIVQGHTALSHETSVRALALSEAAPDLVGQAHFCFAGSALNLGRPLIASTHFDLAVELTGTAVSLLVGTRMEVHARGWQAHGDWLLGEHDLAVTRADGALALARHIEHPYSLAVGLAYAAVLRQIRGDRASLAHEVAELRALCRRHEIAYYGEWATVLGGWLTGGPDGATQIQEGIDRLRSQGAYARMPYWLALLGETLLGSGSVEAARAVLDAAVVAAELRDDRWWLPEVLRLRAQLEPGAAGVELLHRAIDLAQRQDSLTLAARAEADLADRTLGTVRGRSAESTRPGRATNGKRTPVS